LSIKLLIVTNLCLKAEKLTPCYLTTLRGSLTAPTTSYESFVRK